MTLVTSSISNITKKDFSRRVKTTIKIAITNIILKFRQANNVLTLYIQINLIHTTKMIGIMAMEAIYSNTLGTITSKEVEVIKVVECTKILFRITVIIMTTREILSILNNIKWWLMVLECKATSNNLCTEGAIIQEASNIKVHNKFNSLDRVNSTSSHNTTHNFKMNLVIINKTMWTCHN